MLWEHPCQSTRSLLAPSVDGPMLSRSSPRRQLTAGSVSTSAPTIAWVQIWYYFKILFHSIFAKQIPFGADALHRLYLRFFFFWQDINGLRGPCDFYKFEDAYGVYLWHNVAAPAMARAAQNMRAGTGENVEIRGELKKIKDMIGKLLVICATVLFIQMMGLYST